MIDTLEHRLIAALRANAYAFAAGDQVAPCAVLWLDPERLWENVLPALQMNAPELFIFGAYDPAKRTGPALWLRCVEARTVETSLPAGVTPIFYLPGISRERLRATEEVGKDLAPLVDLQFRGTVWLHPNGKEWTPYGFLVSKHGGLGLEVAKDQATLDALAGALPLLLDARLSELSGRLMDAEFLNELIAPDAAGLILRWLNDPKSFQERRAGAEWKAFVQQCKADFKFDPDKDGPLKAAQLLAERNQQWGQIWQRFADAPANHPGIVEWLQRASPKNPSLTDTAEMWPDLNARDERLLLKALEAISDRPQDEAIARVLQLEKEHGMRRRHPWRALGQSAHAVALEPLSRLAELCRQSPGAPTAEAFGEYYALEGWRVDAAALDTMAAVGSDDQNGPVLRAMRAIYLPWLETTARQLQTLLGGATVKNRLEPAEKKAGRVLLFADGLRLDVARRLAQRLKERGFDCGEDWTWSTIPSVTATAKPAVSVLHDGVHGGDECDEFTTLLNATGQRLTHDRFISQLEGGGWQVLGRGEIGEPSGSAWTECGALDKRGHNEGWKLARSVELEVTDLFARIRALLLAGWAEVVVVTDHGWLLLPGGLPKVEIKSFLAEHRWGRCAAMKTEAQTNLPVFPWHWNPAIVIATPPGVGCFRAGMEYSHGGVSLEEMVIPRLVARVAGAKSAKARLAEARWTGARCRVQLEGASEGVRVDVRTVRSDPSTSLLTERQGREVTGDGKVTVFLERDSDIGKTAEIVALDAAGVVIDALQTKIGD